MVSFHSAEFLTSANALEGCPPDRGAEVAFAGRSNAGKSSALNVITNRRALARISKTPGRTQLINFFSVAPETRLVDLPGYGYARVPARVRAHWRQLMGSYFQERQSLAGLMVIMDVRRPLMPFDLQMLAYGGAAGLPMHVLLTKADKLSRGAASGVLQKTRAQLDPRVTIQLFSALKNTGVEQARAQIAVWLGASGEVQKEKDPGAN
jgi:GTP-binding protein